MFHQNLAHTGKSEYTAPKTNQTLWKINTGSQVGSPVVVGGLIYVGSYDRKIYALDASNGDLVWNFTTGGPVYSSAAVDDGIVYIGSRDHNIYALDALTGNMIWNYTTGGYVDSSPAVANGIVYFGSYDHVVYAIGDYSSSP